MDDKMAISIIPLFLILLIIVGLVFSLIRYPKHTAIALGSLVALGVVLFFFALVPLRVSSNGGYNYNSPASATVQSQPTAVTSPMPDDVVMMEQPYTPHQPVSVFPGMASPGMATPSVAARVGVLSIGVIILVVFGLFRYPKQTLIALGSLAALGVVFLFYWKVGYRETSTVGPQPYIPQSPVAVTSEMITPNVPSPVASDPYEVVKPMNIWQDKLELELRPDKYSSAQNALNAAMKDIAGHEYLNPKSSAAAQAAVSSPAASMLMNPEMKLYICDISSDRQATDQDDLNFTAAELQNAVEVIKANHKGAVRLNISIVKQDELASLAAGSLILKIDQKVQVKKKDFNVNSGNGYYTQNIDLSEGSVDLTLTDSQSADYFDSRKFFQTDWMKDLPGFTQRVRTASGLVNVATGASESACPNAEVATQQAIEMVTEKLKKTFSGNGLLTASDILSNGLIRDIFLQQLSTSQGMVWRANALSVVDINQLRAIDNERQNKYIAEQNIQSQQEYQSLIHQRESWAQMAMSFIGVLVGVTVAWFVADYATKGFYRGRIIIILLIILVLVAAMLIP